ncbi:hypothetical protein HJC23_008385 [Cyclotella cryptica]|uniref:Uncharacterized protein n=1 Tax=Cyclotella cryptica TaxID=29204 RepID=A0ABD3PL27_9STRA|eukprot:CCRYP_014035-RA/>CCRYP_014035-RA protein AED:0.00 eAED:0.00 QI:86/-1/1/1/-1/1/1/35/230
MAALSRTIVHRGNFTSIVHNIQITTCRKSFRCVNVTPSCRCLNGSIRANHNVTTNPWLGGNTADSNDILVPPPPSWSVNDLRLTASGSSSEDEGKLEQISEEELATLARRCLIDVRRLSPDRRSQLRTDIAGIMRCASVLLDSKLNSEGDCTHALSDTDIYDAPRGQTKIPIRRDVNYDHRSMESVIKTDGGDYWEQFGESKAVIQTETVKEKMIVVGGEKFFSVVTKRD